MKKLILMSAKKEDEAKVVVVLRVRGVTGLNPKRSRAMELLNIPRQNQASIIKLNPSYRGMVKECKDYVTWGEASEQIIVKMLSKRGKIEGKKISTVKKPEEIEQMAKDLLSGKSLKELKIDKTFRLSPPKKGWKNRKANYPMGDLGKRPSIDPLLRRMI